MSNLVGNAPNQVPTNADLGDLAYQDADYVRVGDIRVDGTITANTITPAGASSVTVNSNLVASGNLSVNSNLAVTGNITAQGNIDLVGSINMSAGNIFLNTGNLSTSPNAVITRGYLDAQLIVFGF